ncbi:large conductance mechanosensitive channel protein MscL [Falsibacillus albus]|uniref:Large-conductance mechanosensitive channel n=1 Tax=Falsibacillus albus TaxID=2478915 RepID=A0A3L7JSB8_9BACI|nr:large conductance mechanosensitive channel protein MscL [Falsibacillus albus]RLQ93380.1 large conductance mechanosensitive channel protein MscL [Falsibacillus albus]
MWNEFKKFAVKGNVIDLAVGIIIGGAFGKIVSSAVNDIIMPIVGIMMGGVDFSKLSYQFYHAEIKYGLFLQTVLDFFLIAFSIFLFVHFYNRFRRKEEEKPAAAKPDPKEELLKEIRDLLKNQSSSEGG